MSLSGGGLSSLAGSVTSGTALDPLLATGDPLVLAAGLGAGAGSGAGGLFCELQATK
jgi:hypothetical protein